MSDRRVVIGGATKSLNGPTFLQSKNTNDKASHSIMSSAARLSPLVFQKKATSKILTTACDRPCRSSLEVAGRAFLFYPTPRNKCSPLVCADLSNNQTFHNPTGSISVHRVLDPDLWIPSPSAPILGGLLVLCICLNSLFSGSAVLCSSIPIFVQCCQCAGSSDVLMATLQRAFPYFLCVPRWKSVLHHVLYEASENPRVDIPSTASHSTTAHNLGTTAGRNLKDLLPAEYEQAASE